MKPGLTIQIDLTRNRRYHQDITAGIQRLNDLVLFPTTMGRDLAAGIRQAAARIADFDHAFTATRELLTANAAAPEPLTIERLEEAIANLPPVPAAPATPVYGLRLNLFSRFLSLVFPEDAQIAEAEIAAGQPPGTRQPVAASYGLETINPEGSYRRPKLESHTETLSNGGTIQWQMME